MKNPTDFYKIIANDLNLKLIVMELVVNFRMIIFCADPDCPSEALKIFDETLTEKISRRLQKITLEHKTPKFQLAAAIKKIIKQMTSQHQLNVIWITQLAVGFFRQNGFSLIFGNYHSPLMSILIEHERIIYENLRRKMKLLNKLPPEIMPYKESWQEIKMHCNEHMADITERYERYVPPLSFFGLILAMIYLLCYALGVIPLSESHLLKMFLSINMSFLTNYYLSDAVQSVLGVVEVVARIPTRRNYFCLSNLPVQFQRSLDEQFYEIVDNKPKPIKLKTKIQPPSRPQQNVESEPVLVSASHHFNPAQRVKAPLSQPTFERKADTLETELALKSARYLPRGFFGNNALEAETVVFTLPDKSNLIYRVDSLHEKILRLWSTPNKYSDPFGHDCVYYPETTAPEFLNAASFARVGTGFIFIENRSDRQSFPKMKNMDGKEELPRFKVKTLHSENRLPIYPWGIFKSNKGKCFKLHYPGPSLKIKH